MPPNHPTIPVAATSDALRRLVGLRYVVVALLAGSLAAMHFWLALAVPLAPAIACLVALILINGAIHWRLPQPIGEAALFGNLVAEVLALTALFYFVGGSTNPLVSLYLLPLTFAANLLPRRHTWALALLAVVGYSLLLAWYVPLEPPATADVHGAHAGHGGHGELNGEAHGASFGMHVLGMWVIFAVSAGLIAHYLSSLASSLRERDRQLAAAREETLRGERIVALGTLAAGAAHELGTPLGNVLLIADELERRYADDAVARAELADLRAEIRRCKGILGDVVAAAGGTRAEGGHLQPADAYLEALRDSWHLVRPAVRASFEWMGARPAPPLVAEQTLAQALVNLLDNAADAAPGELVEVEGRCVDGTLQIDIRDRGPGITPELQAKAGDIFFTRERSPNNMGLGIGLFLANATIERAGGSVRLTNREGGGALTRVTLPLTAAEGERR